MTPAQIRGHGTSRSWLSQRSVIGLQDAQDELAQIWLDSDIRGAVTVMDQTDSVQCSPFNDPSLVLSVEMSFRSF